MTGVWTEVSLRARPQAAEAVADVLLAFTGAGVAIEPPIRLLGPDEGYVLDGDGVATLRGYVAGPVDGSRRRRLRRALRACGIAEGLVGRLRWRMLAETDWAEAWKEHFQVQRVGRVVIRPGWREYDPLPGEAVVTLDPGMAFGTGDHPTTRMCLLALQDLLRPADSVLDLGTGSGALALAAAALGARECVAVDIEEQALASALANVALNAAGGRVRVLRGSLNEAMPAGPFDLVLANINAATVAALARQLADALRPGGALVAGGVIAERQSVCTEALAAAGLTLETTLAEGEWRTVVARKPVGWLGRKNITV